MKLTELLQGCGYQDIQGSTDTDVTDIIIDSRKVTPGALYVCIPGTKVDGHAFAAQVAQRGAAALVVEHWVEDVSIPQVRVADSREALAKLAAAFHGNPADELCIIGVTGTNGKTTTTYLLKSIFESAGEKVGLMGTIATLVGDEVLPQMLTTPDPMEFHAALRRMADAGCKRVVMEVSAHAMALRKMVGVRFAASIFTNLTQDHLDDFKTMENYKGAKKLLFTDEMSDAAVLNADDPSFAYFAEGFHNRTIAYSSAGNAPLHAEDRVVKPDGISFTLCWEGRKLPLSMQLTGHFNIDNALGAAGAALAVGVPLETVQTGLQRVQAMNGRMERVETGKDFTVIVDYAHTPDSLENLLKAAKVFVRNRIIAVFGCGGDRDRTKRPIMGRIAGELADYIIITSDNPRTEEPESIIDMIEPGVANAGKPYVRIADRHEAIGKAVKMAVAGDVVLIAGKGHETYQDVMGVKRHFDDREVAREFIAQHD